MKEFSYLSQEKKAVLSCWLASALAAVLLVCGASPIAMLAAGFGVNSATIVCLV